MLHTVQELLTNKSLQNFHSFIQILLVSDGLRQPQHLLVIDNGLSEIPPVVVAGTQVAVRPGFFHLVTESSGYPKMLSVTVDG